MIFLPIVTILAVVLKKAGWAFLSASLQLLLALAALIFLTYLISTGLGDNVLAWLSDFSLDNLTATGYALIIGLLLAPIASLLAILSKKN
ncbi:hypothetical protein AWM75_03340 [Aerococcus urinaehominis]|uniref:Uncharacterized protein n=1 Tax=Aerococcus urinaehominis TaxID=128944 RepID=A0A0X8FKP4_9LACT|nr:hypothetical protein [Aerococcus urinaehominis]AMB99093.1 hypothetical protein AWM75_03340 [Aerococcus urinaehominis]SDM03399.1 hypothetical protein SAMN04487985_10426 [Aerococcus urinaehominis]